MVYHILHVNGPQVCGKTVSPSKRRDLGSTAVRRVAGRSFFPLAIGYLVTVVISDAKVRFLYAVEIQLN